MIFFKKRSNAQEQSSNKEACLSVLGLIFAIGLIGGLAGLIYGLVVGDLSGIIGGSVIFGISLILTIIFVLVVVFCLKNNNINSHTNNQKQRRRRKPNQRIKQEHSSHEITTVSAIHGYEHSPSVHMELSDSRNNGYGKQISHSPSKPSTFNYLNQSNTSNNSYPLRQNNSNRH